MAGEFSFSDLRRVHWGSTVKLTLARGFFAGLGWAILIGASQGAEISLLAVPFVWMIIAVPIALTIQLSGMLFRAYIPLLGLWMHFVGSLMICIGDPIVYLINRSFPALLETADLRIFNFKPMLFITYPD